MSNYFYSPGSEHLLPNLNIAPVHGAQVVIDANKTTLWVNVDGQCVLRICRCPGSIQLEEMLPDNWE